MGYADRSNLGLWVLHDFALCFMDSRHPLQYTIGALIVRIRVWGPLYYNHTKERPKIIQEIIEAPILQSFWGACKLYWRPNIACLASVRAVWATIDPTPPPPPPMFVFRVYRV